MAKKLKTSRTQIKNLPAAEKELTAKDARNIVGGKGAEETCQKCRKRPCICLTK